MSSEPIQVFIRFRPLNDQELIDNELPMWHTTKNTVSIRKEYVEDLIDEKKIPPSFNPCFHYNHIFSSDETVYPHQHSQLSSPKIKNINFKSQNLNDENQKIYEIIAQKIVLSTLEGYNATIFAYGQTGTGKTFTMFGTTPGNENMSFISNKPRGRRFRSPTSRSRSINSRYRSTSAFGYKFEKLEKPKKSSMANSGMISLSLSDIFKAASNCKNKHFFFKCSMMRIYNEHIYDLLKDPEDLTSEILTVEETEDEEFYIKGLSEHVVTSIEEALEKLARGEMSRQYAANNLNHHSSRSNTIFRMSIKSLEVVPKKEEEVDAECEENFETITTESILDFVDLAGSERSSFGQIDDGKDMMNLSFTSSPFDQDRVSFDGKSVNMSLFYLCQIINKLSEQKKGLTKANFHLPYRNSILTKILHSSLDGNSRTSIICTASPALSQFEHTLSTLRLANSARILTNPVKPNIKRETNYQILQSYQQDIAELKKELEKAKEHGWQFYNQNNIVKCQLENKLIKLTEMYNNMNISGTLIVKEDVESNYTILSSTISGDLMLLNKQINEFNQNVLSKAHTKFDISGQIAQFRLGIMRNENRKIIEKIDNNNKNLSMLKIAKLNVRII